MGKFEDLMSKLATDSSENPIASEEEINEVISEYQGKQTEIDTLNQSLKEKTDEYEKLKSRVIENLFNKKEETPLKSQEKEEEEEKTVSFKDLINSEYAIRK